MRPLLVAASVAALFSVGTLLAPPWASATNATVTYAQTCDEATVTVTSSWEGVSHVHVTGPSPEITFDVPAHGTASARFKIVPTSLHATVSSSNAHLQGDLTHTFTARDCDTGETTTTPPTTVGGVVPPGGEVTTTTTAATAVSLAPEIPTTTTSPSVEAPSGPSRVGARTPTPAQPPVRIALPPTE